jgi:hypothetical protein
MSKNDVNKDEQGQRFFDEGFFEAMALIEKSAAKRYLGFGLASARAEVHKKVCQLKALLEDPTRDSERKALAHEVTGIFLVNQNNQGTLLSNFFTDHPELFPESLLTFEERAKRIAQAILGGSSGGNEGRMAVLP